MSESIESIVAEEDSIRELPEEEYDAWYRSSFMEAAYTDAAEALRKGSARAFIRGQDDVAFFLREKADALDELGKDIRDEWHEKHQQTDKDT